MFGTVVVALDGSSLAERAVPYAIGLAQSTGGRLVLTRAALAAPPMSVDGSELEQAQAHAVEEATAYLSDMAESISGQVSGVDISAPYGRAVDKILETIQTYHADAVVMATHGRTGLGHLLYGSVTEGVLASTSVPVFVVHARPGQPVQPSFSPSRATLLVPQDGSAFDAPALQTALDLVGPHGEIVLLTVAQPPEHVQLDESGRHIRAYLDQQEEALTRAAREHLASIVHALRERQVHVAVKMDVRLGDPTSGIAVAARDHRADLIVMATHGRTGLARAVLGSVAGSVLRAVNTPVVLVRPKLAEATIDPRTGSARDVLAATPMF